VHPDRPDGPPPGWYPDPWGAKAWRWWDGYLWTGYASDPQVPGQPADQTHQTAPVHPGHQTGFQAVPSVYDRFAAEQSAVRWGKRAFFGFLLVYLVGELNSWRTGPSARDAIRSLWAHQQVGVFPHHGSAALASVSYLLLLVDAGVYVALLIWQFRAAKTAQLLYLPAQHSPGLGVGSWFIPVVNLWFPYQAIRDSLPPEDSGRSAVSRMWSYFILGRVTNLVTTVLAFTGSPIGFVFAAVTLGLTTGFAVYGARSVQLIAGAHQRLLYPGHPPASAT
jgi:hypothetical protein